MPADPFTLRQADQIRGDLYGIQDDLDFIKVQLARLPTPERGLAGGDARDVRRGGRCRDADRGICAVLALGNADLLEPHGGRLPLRDGVPSHAVVIRPANLPCPRCRCIDADRGILSVMSLSRVFISAGLACCVAFAPSPAPAKTYRSLEVKHEFQRQHPCPSTGRPTGACPGYIKDHIVSLACGGVNKH